MFELLQLAFLARDENVDVLRIDVTGQHFAVVQLAQGIAQVVRQALLVLLVGVAFGRRAWIDLVGQTMVNAGQHGRHQQVRVGIGTGNAVFDTHGVRRAGRYAQGHGAVVQTPGRGVRHVELGTKPAVRVDVRAEERHRRRQGLEHTADRVTQRGVLLGILAGEDVLAILVQHRDMDVQTIARLARVRLGHEGGVHLMVVGDVLDQSFEQYRVIAGLQRVSDVVQVHFELRRCTFLDDGVGRDALFLGAFENVLQAVDVFVEVVDQVDLGRLRTFAGNRRAWRLWTAVHVLLVDQVELQFEGGADGQAQLVEFRHDLTQDFPRVGEERLAFDFMHGHQQLRSRALLPRLIGESVGDGIADAVSVADVQAQACAFDGGTVDIQCEKGGRQVDAFLVNLVEAGALNALAAHHTIHICNQKVNVENLRMFLKERVRFVKLNGTRGYRHDATPLLLKISINGGLQAQSIGKPG